MEIDESFRLVLPVAEAWPILTDLRRVAAWVPGASPAAVTGDEHRGVLEVGFGAITARYEGIARLESVDEATHTAILVATGRDTRGQGNATATIKLTLGPDGTGSHVDVDADLSITGTVGQFGHDVIAGVFTSLVAQFVENLERDVLTADVVDLTADDHDRPEASEADDDELVAEAVAAGAEPAASPSGNGAAVPKAHPVADPARVDPPVERLESSGEPILRRAAPLVGLVAAALLTGWLARRRKR